MVIEDQIIGDLQSLDSVEILDDNTRKARAIRQGMQTNLNLIDPTTGEVDPRPSSHLMSHGSVDGKFYAFPTLFPGYENKEDQVTEEWKHFKGKEGEFNWDAFDYAARKDVNELFEFDTEEEARLFAEGSWKPEELK